VISRHCSSETKVREANREAIPFLVKGRDSEQTISFFYVMLTKTMNGCCKAYATVGKKEESALIGKDQQLPIYFRSKNEWLNGRANYGFK